MHTMMRANILSKKRVASIFIGLSLSFASQACQTTTPSKMLHPSQANIEEKLLQSQLVLVQNALDNGQPEKSHGILRESLQKFPDNAQLHNFMGLTQLALKNPKRAIIHFERSLEISPDVGVGLNLSSAYIDVGDYKKALIKLKSLVKEARIKSYPYQERIHHNIGYTLLKLRKNRDSEKWFKKALEENPTFFPTHLELGRLYLSQGRDQDALVALKRSHDYCLPCWEPIELLTEYYRDRKQYQEATSLLVSYLKTTEITEISKNLGHKLLQEIHTRQSSLAQKPLLKNTSQR
jgi:tetratricopeptide (TPR) repeat protein